jgi:hypothetical protein
MQEGKNPNLHDEYDWIPTKPQFLQLPEPGLEILISFV